MNAQREESRVKHGRLKEQQQTIRVLLSVSAAVVGLFGVVELVFKMYEFNGSQHRGDRQVLQQSRGSHI